MAQGTTKGVPIDTDPSLSANSDLLVPSQKAIKTYVDANASVGHTIQDAGVNETQRTNLNFQRMLVTDDAGNNATVVARPSDTFIGITAPANPVQGDEWTNSETWSTYKYYDGFWVEISNINPSAVAGTGTTGQVAYFNGTSSITGESNLFWDATNDRLGIGTNSPGVKLDVVGNTTTLNTAQFGTIGIQSYAVNNAWFGDNVYFDGTVFRRRSAGYTGLFYYAGNEGQFRFASSGSAGSAVAEGSSNYGKVIVKMNLDGTVAFGDNMSHVAGTYTGAKLMTFGATGNVTIGTTTDSGFKLDVNGTFRQSGSTTAASGLAVGSTITPSLTAAANSDVLVGLDINPTFTNGAFTGVRNIGIRTTGDFVFNSPTTVHYNGYNFGASTYYDGYNFYNILRQTTKVFSISIWNGTAGSILSTDQRLLITPSTTTNWNLNFIANTGANADLTFITGSTTVGKIFANGNWFIGASPVDSGFRLDVNGLVNFTGTTASDGGQLGAELLSASGWTSTDWTGSFATGWTHTTGNTTALTNTLAAVNNTYYYISFTVTGRTAGTFTISFGGFSYANLSASSNFGPLTTSIASLSITPTTDFDGTIVISIKQITGGSANLTIKNSSGGNGVQIRYTQGNNFFIGQNAGARVVNSANYGYDNIGIGDGSLVGLTTGTGNTAVGRLAAYQTTYGNFNTAIGTSALQQNKSGGSNTIIGWSAGLTLSSGGANTAVGTSSLYSNVSGNNNTAIGDRALNLSTGTGNTAVGALSIGNNTSGTNNTALGLVAALNNSTGSNFVSIGANSTRYYAGGTSAATSFSNGVYIGDTTKVGAAGAANEIVIGYQAEGLGSNTTVIGNSSTTYGRWWGNLLVGTSTNSGYALDVSGTARISNYLYVSGGFGSGLATSATNTSLYLFNRRISTSGDGITIDDFNQVNGTNVNINNLNFVSSSSVAIGATSTLNIIAISKTYDLAVSTTSSSIIRGFYYNPTITNLRVAQHRAIETVTGDIYFASTSGSVGIGVLPSATYKLDVNGTARIQDNLTISDAKNIILNTTTGTKIGTATTQKLSFWNAAPVSQPTTGVTSATLVGGGGTTLTDTDTFDGYTLKQIVAALRQIGLLA